MSTTTGHIIASTLGSVAQSGVGRPSKKPCIICGVMVAPRSNRLNFEVYCRSCRLAQADLVRSWSKDKR